MPNRKEIELYGVQLDSLRKFKRVSANLRRADAPSDIRPGEFVHVSEKGDAHAPVLLAKIEKITYDDPCCCILLSLCGPYDCFD